MMKGSDNLDLLYVRNIVLEISFQQLMPPVRFLVLFLSLRAFTCQEKQREFAAISMNLTAKSMQDYKFSCCTISPLFLKESNRRINN